MYTIQEFVRPELSIIIVFLYCLGLFLKLCDNFRKDWMIPYILLGISFIVNFCYVIIYEGQEVSGPMIIIVIIESVLTAAVAVFGNELIKQITIKRKSD